MQLGRYSKNYCIRRFLILRSPNENSDRSVFWKLLYPAILRSHDENGAKSVFLNNKISVDSQKS